MTVLLFPGQGAQRPGFLHDLPDRPEIAATLAEAGAVLGTPALALDGEEALRSTVAVQLSLLIAGVATARIIAADAVAGLSVGSFAAGVAAGAIAFADALRLVRLRASLMERAYPSGYGMAALGGLRETRVAALIAAATAPGEPLYIANLNAPAEIVATGAEAALERLIGLARAAGARRAVRLAVSVPSHCPLLAPVAERLAREIEGIDLAVPRRIWVGNRRARVLRDVAAVRGELAGNLAHPVLWHDSVALLHELGERLFLEAPPGEGLTALVAAHFPDATARAVAATPPATLEHLIRVRGAAEG